MNRSMIAFAMVATAFAAFAKEPRQIDNNGRGGRPHAALEERGKRGEPGRDGAAFVSEQARALASAYRANPTEEAKAALLEQLRADYDAALARAKERVQNMENNREARISAAMKRLVSASPEAADDSGERKGPPRRGEGGKRPGGPRSFRHPSEAGEPPAPPPPEADEPPAPAPDDGGEPPAPPPEGGFSMVP